VRSCGRARRDATRRAPARKSERLARWDVFHLIDIAERKTNMNWDQVAGNWKQLKGKAQQSWGKLTNDDLDVISGRREELAGRVQERYGVAKEEAERQVDRWLKTL
jgi:uncharacterized protein YjbJ (UPF0337 family)